VFLQEHDRHSYRLQRLDFGDGVVRQMPSPRCVPERQVVGQADAYRYSERFTFTHPFQTAPLMGQATAVLTTCSPGGADGAPTWVSDPWFVTLPLAPAASAAWPDCTASMVKLTDTDRGDAATGHVGVTVDIRNVSSQACQTRGFPDLTLRGKSGERLPHHVVAAADSFMWSNIGIHRVALRPGDVASFSLTWVDFPIGKDQNPKTACPLSAAVDLRMPHTQSTKRFPYAIGPCTDVGVSALLPGPTGFFQSHSR
jgi:hypothetical protein